MLLMLLMLLIAFRHATAIGNKGVHCP